MSPTILTMIRSLQKILFCCLFLPFSLSFSLSCLAAAQPWAPVGPDGGDARSFAADPSNPQHLYVGTTSGWIYQSNDDGASWRPLAKLPGDENLIIDNLVVDKADPSILYAGAFVIDLKDGGIFVSHDSGATWTETDAMKGQPIQALEQSASNPKILVAGTMRGIYRSDDGGAQWKQISPLGSLELHEVESIAIDPKDPQVIYAGTWHLPWKTTDGGATWHNIKQGLIDDSDVFSIIIDPQKTNVVYTSACSGIYRSDNGGEIYHKVQGIPTTARRTRVLMQDPLNSDIVYAGTTEGLYKTVDGGIHWDRLTGPDVIVNDVYVDPKNTQHVLLATDRGGVLKSDDAGMSFTASNDGFSQRQVTTLLVDAKQPGTIYAGVVNDKTHGGVFASTDGGNSWHQQSNGLEGRDVYTLAQTGDGALLAGTNAGIFIWDGNGWHADGTLVVARQKVSYVMRHGKRTKVESTVNAAAGQIDGRASAIYAAGDLWVAAAAKGIYVSDDHGLSWKPAQGLDSTVEFSMLAGAGNTVLAAQRKALAASTDGGKNWQMLSVPAKLDWLDSIAAAPDGSLWAGGGGGLFYSRDNGRNWQQMSKLPIDDISNVNYDAELGRVVVTSWRSTWVFAIDPANGTWKWWDAGWSIRNVHASSGRLMGSTLFNGVVLQPKTPPDAAQVEARK
jgi:photosystem II stability/assembly factor-like uncharacterized protein